VLCLDTEHHSRKKLSSHDEVDGIRVFRIPYLDLKYYKPAWLPLDLLKSADLLHVHGVGAMLDFAVATKGLHRKPIVVSTHGGIFHTATIGWVKKLYFSGFERLMLRGVDRVVACSQSDFELFKPVAKRLTRIDNGVELSRFKGIAMDRKEPTRFLVLGRISRNKQVDQIIDALAFLRGKSVAGAPFSLRIVGFDWENLRPELEAQIARKELGGMVTLTGEVPEEQLRTELEHAAFALSASRYEGFGIAVVEAMAAGCVPLLNRIPAFESFVEDGKTGFWIDFSEPEKAAERIAAISAMDVSDVRANAVTKAWEFDWSECIGKWEALYRALGENR
jgi:alpha-1,3-mannosyltransferase